MELCSSTLEKGLQQHKCPSPSPNRLDPSYQSWAVYSFGSFQLWASTLKTSRLVSVKFIHELKDVSPFIFLLDVQPQKTKALLFICLLSLYSGRRITFSNMRSWKKCPRHTKIKQYLWSCVTWGVSWPCFPIYKWKWWLLDHRWNKEKCLDTVIGFWVHDCVKQLCSLSTEPGMYLTQSFRSCLTEMSGTAADISLVHWRQQWLENGTLYFHVSMSSSGQLAQATAPTLQEPSEIVEEQMHILHISVMVSGWAWDEGGGQKEAWGWPQMDEYEYASKRAVWSSKGQVNSLVSPGMTQSHPSSVSCDKLIVLQRRK